MLQHSAVALATGQKNNRVYGAAPCHRLLPLTECYGWIHTDPEHGPIETFTKVGGAKSVAERIARVLQQWFFEKWCLCLARQVPKLRISRIVSLAKAPISRQSYAPLTFAAAKLPHQ